MNKYLIQVKGLYYIVQGTNATLAYWNARRMYGPETKLVNRQPIENRPIMVENGEIEHSSACQGCLVYLSKCFC